MFGFIKQYKKNKKANSSGEELAKELILRMDNYFADIFPQLLDEIVKSFKEDFEDFNLISNTEKIQVISSSYNHFIQDVLPIFNNKVKDDFIRKHPIFFDGCELLGIKNEFEYYFNYKIKEAENNLIKEAKIILADTILESDK